MDRGRHTITKAGRRVLRGLAAERRRPLYIVECLETGLDKKNIDINDALQADGTN